MSFTYRGRFSSGGDAAGPLGRSQGEFKVTYSIRLLRYSATNVSDAGWPTAAGRGQAPGAALRTLLYHHQEKAVRWMRAKEQLQGDDLDEAGDTVARFNRAKRSRSTGEEFFWHSVTGVKSSFNRGRPCEGRGGLLADEMGVGKTLTVLALIVRSLPDANDRPTLIIASKTVVAVWEEELGKHLQPERIGWFIHYGDRRAHSVDLLKSVPIVVTSYETVIDDAQMGGQYCNLLQGVQ